ncbi:MAG: hypothetical protein PHY42_06300 [Bacilli bacterium]|nr:hypothetical protein [Bacilli bacterium]
MRIIEAVKKAETEAEQMRLDAIKQVDEMLEAAKVKAHEETKTLNAQYQEETKEQEIALQTKIKKNQEVLVSQWQGINQDLAKKAKARFPQAIEKIIKQVNPL